MMERSQRVIRSYEIPQDTICHRSTEALVYVVNDVQQIALGCLRVDDFGFLLFLRVHL